MKITTSTYPPYEASTMVGKIISQGDIVIYEFTIYPGMTEDECIPVVERVNGLKFNEDFYTDDSPERMNPGDRQLRACEYGLTL